MDEMRLKFDPNYSRWRNKFETEPVYTRKQMGAALSRQAQELTVNRVIQSFDEEGRVGSNCARAMQILAVHKTPHGITVIVK